MAAALKVVKVQSVFYNKIYPKLSQLIKESTKEDKANGFINPTTGDVSPGIKEAYIKCMLKKGQALVFCLDKNLSEKQIKSLSENLGITDPASLLKEERINNGGFVSAVTLNDGQIYKVGRMDNGSYSQLAQGDSCPEGFTKRKVGESFICEIKPSGTLYSFGNNQCKIVSDSTGSTLMPPCQDCTDAENLLKKKYLRFFKES